MDVRTASSAHSLHACLDDAGTLFFCNLHGPGGLDCVGVPGIGEPKYLIIHRHEIKQQTGFAMPPAANHITADTARKATSGKRFLQTVKGRTGNQRLHAPATLPSLAGIARFTLAWVSKALIDKALPNAA